MSKLEKAIEALKKIADPIRYFQGQVPTGATLNGVVAVSLSNDPAWLRQVALEAIVDLESNDEIEGQGRRVVPSTAEPLYVREVQLTAPKRIYLNVSDDIEYHARAFPRDPHGDEVTWSEGAALECTVAYVRADLAARPPAHAKDAQRYRWLKANADVTFHEHQWFFTAQGQRIHSTSATSEELDAAVDSGINAAIAKAGGEA